MMKLIRDTLFNKRTRAIWILIILSMVISSAYFIYPTSPFPCDITMIQVILFPLLNVKILFSKIKPVSNDLRIKQGMLIGAFTGGLPTLPSFIKTSIAFFLLVGKETYIISVWNSRGYHIPVECIFRRNRTVKRSNPHTLRGNVLVE